MMKDYRTDTFVSSLWSLTWQSACSLLNWCRGLPALGWRRAMFEIFRGVAFFALFLLFLLNIFTIEPGMI